jgi:anthranilate synthase component 1
MIHSSLSPPVAGFFVSASGQAFAPRDDQGADRGAKEDTMISPTRSQYTDQTRSGRRVPVRMKIAADLDTPVSVFLKLKPLGASFLLESVEKGLQVGRYSFIGMRPARTIRLQDEFVTTRNYGGAAPEETRQAVDPADPLAAVKEYLAAATPIDDPETDLPAPFGGAVGFLGYDLVRYFDDIALPPGDGQELPDFHFLFPETMVVFDHVKNEIELVTLPAAGDPEEAHNAASAELQGILTALQASLPHRVLEDRSPPDGEETPTDLESNFSREGFMAAVEKAKEHILAGDAFQIVLSQRLSRKTPVDAFQVFRALRILNPSPYLFFLDCEDFQLVGSSPEMLVRLEGDRLQVNPIAGTRPRGQTAQEDAALSEELLADEKERAEHVMLVDLGRNDLGRVCRSGSVAVDEFMNVERYSHVMHLVSRVSGRLEKGKDMFDALRATFPAGTVSGAPKIRAMQIISEQEPDRRGIYAGAVGYFGLRGDMDMCITIRTLIMRDGGFEVQAGAGIVADSDPAREFQETLNKIGALTRAVANAERGV